MLIRDVQARSILSKSGIFDYSLNPYTGCQFGCTYCYARFMKRFSEHKENWGEFLDVKINAPFLLEKEIKIKRRGKVWISGVCDPYQPIEAEKKLTRRCLEILFNNNWPIRIQTKSELILRDIDLIRSGRDVEVGLTITTGDDKIRQLFEPEVTPIAKRVNALEQLYNAGIKTFAMIAPLLPGAEKLVTILNGRVGYIIIDKMNYHYSDWIYRKFGLGSAKSRSFMRKISSKLASGFQKQGLHCQILFE